MANQKKNQNLLLLFDRPKEPVFMPKGKDKVVFDAPDRFFTEKYKSIGNEIQSRFGDDAGVRIPVKDVTKLPDLSLPMELGRQDNFTLFLPAHQKMSSRLITIFMGAKDVEELQSVAVYARDRINPQMFNYALSVALLNRPDTKNLDLPLFSSVFPDKFIDSRVMSRAREELNVVPEGSRQAILIPKDYTASDLEPEHRLWYFREDMGVNLHHWHWHLVYPFEADDVNIVRKDRRGEIFYYMHQQIVARYNYERFSNNLPRVKSLDNLRAPIEEGYFSKLDSLVASRSWPARPSGTTLKNVDRRGRRDQVTLNISDMERFEKNIIKAIDQGYAEAVNGQQIPLDNTNGVDVLGDMLEASILTPNRALYGSLHNFGHVMISFVHDPDSRHLESIGVIGDSSTSMRDPVFYRWHMYTDNLFQRHKVRLTPYTDAQLTFPGIAISSLQIGADGGQANILNTHWQQSDMNMTKGMDFVQRGDVFARFQHLQHVPYTITLQVNNSSGANKLGMVRVFLAPKFDEQGKPFTFNEHRRFFIELDKFVASLKPGQNILKRRSIESTVTIPYERVYRDLDKRPAGEGEAGFNFCGCGWPHYLLLPKGTPSGLRSQLFVMVSNYEEDRVNQDLVGTCNDAAAFCGIRDRLYPDRKPMGFPFDRLARASAQNNLSSFLTANMRTQDVSIVFNDRII